MAATFDLNDIKRRMAGAVAALKHDLNSLRTGRASANLLDPIEVEAYGAAMPLNQVATVSGSGAQAPVRAGLGPQHGAGRREGHHEVGPRHDAADRRPGDPAPRSGNEPAAPPGDGEGCTQVRRAGQGGRAPRAPRRHGPPEEAREGRPTSARTRSPAIRTRSRRRRTRRSRRSIRRWPPKKKEIMQV